MGYNPFGAAASAVQGAVPGGVGQQQGGGMMGGLSSIMGGNLGGTMGGGMNGMGYASPLMAGFMPGVGSMFPGMTNLGGIPGLNNIPGLQGLTAGPAPLQQMGDMFQGYLDKAGITPGKAEDAIKGIGGLANQQYSDMQGVNTQLNNAGNQYAGAVGKNVDAYNKQSQGATNDYTKAMQGGTSTYRQGQGGLSAQAQTAGTQAGRFYGQNVDKQLGQLQGQAMGNAGEAMSLKDAGNVNNSTQKGVRGLYNTEASNAQGAYNKEGATARGSYNKEGQSQQQSYEQQAQGVGRQGLADSGVLAALGSQAMAGQLGGSNLFTGGQLQAMQGANMSQAGQAYGRAQQQMQTLRDQGMNRNMDMRSQGLGQENTYRGQGLDTATQTRNQGMAQGFDQNAQQYGRGQDAQNMALGTTQARQGANNSYQGVEQGLRGEQSGYQGNQYGAATGAAQGIYGAQSGQANTNFQNGMLGAGTQYGVAQDQGARQMASIGGLYQPQMAGQGQLANLYGQYGVGTMGMMGDFAKAVGGAVPLGGGTGG